jgi:hypothetical protein
MAEDAEPEVRILVEDLPLGHVIMEMSGDKVLVLQHVLDERADLLTTFDPGIFRQNAVTLSGKLLESISHQTTSSV